MSDCKRAGSGDRASVVIGQTRCGIDGFVERVVVVIVGGDRDELPDGGSERLDE